MQLRPEQLDAHLARGLQPLYTIHGDEPLLAQEAADAVRAAARARGFDDRTVFSVSGAHFDWSAVLGAAQAPGLFSASQIIDIRIPSGKPGKDGSEALLRYCNALQDGVLTLVQLPRLDYAQQKAAWFSALTSAGVTLRVETPDRRQLPAWLAQRLARQGQRVAEGEAGQRTLAFFADRVEGNLLAAHQEMQKLALLHPPGELVFEQIEAAVLDVARYDLPKLSEAIWTGQTARALRMLDALQAEGEAAVLVHWTLSDECRALARARALLDEGRPLPLALREARVWGAKEKLFERLLPSLNGPRLTQLVHAASICDGIVKGLKHPDWPLDAWAALRRLVLMAVEMQSPARRLALRTGSGV
ncbi:MAG: DNA polymerase III subunit delta [Pseudomonadota bacterium]|nr:DNA polymerase III subunit delta [Pseudomonadota bacterium]